MDILLTILIVLVAFLIGISIGKSIGAAPLQSQQAVALLPEVLSRFEVQLMSADAESKKKFIVKLQANGVNAGLKDGHVIVLANVGWKVNERTRYPSSELLSAIARAASEVEAINIVGYDFDTSH